jgi:hypothetical protein
MSEDLQGIGCGGLELGPGLEDDREAEVAEAADVTSGGPLGVAFVEVVFAEFAVGRGCGEHVIDADDELVSDRQEARAADRRPGRRARRTPAPDRR